MSSLLSFILVIGICVVAHEYGHYLTARLFGVQVHEFAFGMGPVIYSRKGKHNLWSVRIFPVGGFVRLAGMDEEGEGEEIRPGMAFYDKAAWKRFLILLNGSAANIVLALLLTAAFLVGHGVMDLGDTVVGEIMKGYPAQTSGIMEGDRILSVNRAPVDNWRTMSSRIREEALKGPVVFSVDRKGETLLLEAVIEADEQGIPLFGIRPAYKKYPPGEAFSSAFSYTMNMSAEMISGIVRWISGREKMDVTGPVGIASMAGEAARKGLWTFLSFLALINLNLGLINLFPFPALDGGRLFFTAGEMILRRRLPPKTENYIHMTGFFLLIALILYITWHDVVRIFWS
ncbi:MAG: M50 family metallopeptidase [Aminivibrio sp.]|jgi:regulator of sigma E protease